MAMELMELYKWMELGCQLLLDHFGFVHLLQVSKNDDEEHYFLKQLGFSFGIGYWIR